ncbi:MAG: hypothetical protein M5U12_14585 [Verrucomicrobia bacterium]|nr:hypothetical protein [Verrucomicrobiota bacterium]
MRPLPFRLRLAALSALISGVVLVVFGVLAWHFICRERLAALDRELRSLAYRHPGWLGERGGFERLGAVVESVFGADRREQVLVRVASVDGTQRYRSPHWPEDLDPAPLNLPLEDDPQAAPADLDHARRENAVADPLPGGPRGPPWAPGARAGRGGLGPGLGRLRGGALPPSPFSKLPRFLSVTAGESTWRFGVFGHDAERLFLGLNQTELQAELNRLATAFPLGPAPRPPGRRLGRMDCRRTRDATPPRHRPHGRARDRGGTGPENPCFHRRPGDCAADSCAQPHDGSSRSQLPTGHPLQLRRVARAPHTSGRDAGGAGAGPPIRCPRFARSNGCSLVCSRRPSVSRPSPAASCCWPRPMPANWPWPANPCR